MTQQHISHPIRARDGFVVALENELWVVDRRTLQAVNFDGPLSHGTTEVVAGLKEFASSFAHDVGGILEGHRAMRHAAAAAAAEKGLVVVASGSAPQEPPDGHHFTRAERYDTFRAAVLNDREILEASSAGTHVHLRIAGAVRSWEAADKDLATEVVNRVRPHLPAIAALAVNSPFRHGRRERNALSIRMLRWPTLRTYSETAPYAESYAGFQAAALATVEAQGLPSDPTYCHDTARPHGRYETAEFRTNDVGLTYGDDALGAFLIQAVAQTALDEIRAGRRPAYRPHPESFYPMARVLASLGGPDKYLADPSQSIPGEVAFALAREVIKGLVEYAGPALEQAGTLAITRHLLANVLGDADRPGLGTGADRQLAAWAAISKDRAARGLPCSDPQRVLTGRAPMHAGEMEDLALVLATQTVNGSLERGDDRILAVEGAHQIGALLALQPDRSARLASLTFSGGRDALQSVEPPLAPSKPM